MLIISKKRMTFYRSEIITDSKTQEKFRKIHESFTAQFLPTETQVAPDWIREDGLFDLAVQDGTLIVMDGNSGVFGPGPVAVPVMGWQQSNKASISEPAADTAEAS